MSDDDDVGGSDDSRSFPAPDEELEVLEDLLEIEDPDLGSPFPRNDWKAIAIRFGVSIVFLAALIWQLPDVSIDEIVPEVTTATFVWVAIAVAIHVVAYVLQTARWAAVSDTLGIPLPFRRLFSHLLAGEFVSNALPTSFGGDVVRVLRQGRDTGDHADAFAATALERLSGWLVLPLLSSIALLLDPSLAGLGAASTVAIVINVVTVIGLIGVIWAAGHRRAAARILGRSGWRRYLASVHLGILAFRARPTRTVVLLAAGLGFQTMQCLSVYAAARALDLPEITLLATLAFFPPAAIAQNLPIALGGLGVREGAFVLFFGALGVADGSAIALGLLVYFVFIVASLAGAPSFAFGRAAARRPRSNQT